MSSPRYQGKAGAPRKALSRGSRELADVKRPDGKLARRAISFDTHRAGRQNAGDRRRSNFANRYDANRAAKKNSERRKIVPIRFDARRAVLLFKRVSSSHVRFTRARHQVCEGRFLRASLFALCQFPLLIEEGASTARTQRKLMRSFSAANNSSVFDVAGTALFEELPRAVRPLPPHGAWAWT